MRDLWQITDYKIGKVILLHVMDRFDTAVSGALESPSESCRGSAVPCQPVAAGQTANRAHQQDGQTAVCLS